MANSAIESIALPADALLEDKLVQQVQDMEAVILDDRQLDGQQSVAEDHIDMNSTLSEENADAIDDLLEVYFQEPSSELEHNHNVYDQTEAALNLESFIIQPYKFAQDPALARAIKYLRVRVLVNTSINSHKLYTCRADKIYFKRLMILHKLLAMRQRFGS